MEAPKIIPDEATHDYITRSQQREVKLMTATMNFIIYFIGLGDDQATAEDKVGQVSDEVSPNLYQYTLGRTQPLIDKINASTLPFMDAAAKNKLVTDLTIVS
jgi:hypothetical protein